MHSGGQRSHRRRIRLHAFLLIMKQRANALQVEHLDRLRHMQKMCHHLEVGMCAG